MFKKTAIIKTFVIICIIWQSCGKNISPADETVLPSYTRDSALTFLNLAYGDSPLNKLDLYLPSGRNVNTPLVITIHGGGWIHGDKSGCTWRAEQLIVKGCIIANINYNLISPNNNYEGLFNDMDNVIKFFKSNKVKYGIDQNKFHLQGFSAGAHLALLYPYKHNPEDINTIVSYSGPTNINDLYFKKIIDSAWKSPEIPNWLLGEPFVLNSKAALNCSPLYHIKNIPVLLIHGTEDETIPFSQAEALNDSLNAKGIKHLLIKITGGTHSTNGPNAPLYADSIHRAATWWIYNNLN